MDKDLIEQEAQRIFDQTMPVRYASGEPIVIPLRLCSDAAYNYFMKVASLSLEG